MTGCRSDGQTVMTMTERTDRELLEMAARAAGYEYRSANRCIVMDGIPGNWNPLEDDGDALRLAVKLRLCVDNNAGEYGDRDDVTVGPEISTGILADEFRGPNPCAATRRAIVRAAAAMAGR